MVVRKTAPKKEAKKLVLKEQEFNFVENVFLELGTRYEMKWRKDNNTADFSKDNNIVGTITMSNRDMTVEGLEIMSLVKEFSKFSEDNKKHPVTTEEITSSAIKDLLSNRNRYFGLDKNKKAFLKASEALRSAGIDAFRCHTSLEHSSSVYDKLNVVYAPAINRSFRDTPPSGFNTRLRNVLIEHFKLPDSYKTNTGVVPDNDYGFLKTLQDEKVVPIMIKTHKIGQYYPERNLVLLSFNPFCLGKVSMFSEEVPLGVTELISLLKGVNAKTRKTSSLAEKIFVESFLANTNRKIEDKKRNLNDFEKRIDSYQTEIRNAVTRIHDDQVLINHLENLVKTGGKLLFSELEEAKKLPFIKELITEGGNIKVTFNETCIDTPNFSRGDHRKKLGKRTFYLGEITMKISPSNFTVYNTNSIKGHSHPHSSGDGGGPCFGDGDGQRKIYEVLASCQISELMKMLWFWVKTYRNGGAYVKHYDTYDDRLAKGYPVWDEKGNRIEINDKERLESGEQRKLEKEGCYAENVKKFAHMTKPFY